MLKKSPKETAFISYPWKDTMETFWKRALTIYIGKPEIQVGKSHGSRYSIREASENMGCDLRSDTIFLHILICSADLDRPCSGLLSHLVRFVIFYVYAQDFHCPSNFCKNITHPLCLIVSFPRPQWQMVIHDFPADQSQMVTEAIVNMIINSQVQTLLKVFQYKSVSSLYKMLREKITSSLQSYDMHFELCKREIISRLQDPVLTMKFRDMTQRIMGKKCSTQEYVSTDCMLSGKKIFKWIFFLKMICFAIQK